MTISREIGDEDLKFEALHHRWGLVYFKGQTEEMLKCTAEGLEQYDRDRHHKFSYVYAGHDPGACAYCVRALACRSHTGLHRAERMLDCSYRSLRVRRDPDRI